MIKIASYNIRKAVGLDWKRKSRRILDVLVEMDADIVVMQEADKRLGKRPGVLPTDVLRNELDYAFVDFGIMGPNHGWHGNAILFRDNQFTVKDTTRLELPTLEPRGAVSVIFGSPEFEIIGVHLGLSSKTRTKQLKTLSAHTAKAQHPVLIAGDFNSTASNAEIETLFGDGVDVVTPGNTFHTSHPMAALDKFVLTGFHQHNAGVVHETPLAKEASDHLPIVIEVKV